MKVLKQHIRPSKAVIALTFVVLLSCVEFEPVSPIPSIEYTKTTFALSFDSLLNNRTVKTTVEFSFVDGDADIGVFDEINQNTLLPDSVRYGLFCEFYKKIYGAYEIHKFVQINDSTIDTLNQNFLLPYNYKLDRVGQNKTVKGFIRFDIEFRDNVPFDTMMIEFYIRDRALNKSNIERTEDFSLDSVFKAVNF